MRYGNERHNERLMRLEQRWRKALDDQRPMGGPVESFKAPGAPGLPASLSPHSPPTLNAPTDAPASWRATGDAAGAPFCGYVDTERDA